MKVRVFSMKKNRGWEEAGDSLRFTVSKLNSVLARKLYYQLSFNYCFDIDEDKVWFATTIPYTLCRLQKLIKEISLNSRNYDISNVEKGVLTRSLGMLEVPLLTITNRKISEKRKKAIVIIGRVHPAETVGSWVMEGLLKFISSKHPEATFLRNQFVFLVIPMMNVDGVVAGNSRMSMSGDDLNRWYDGPDQRYHPELVAFRTLIRKIGAGRVEVFVDIHGHFRKKGSFMSGPYYSTHSANYIKSKIIPKIFNEKCGISRYCSSRSTVQGKKEGAARLVMFNEFKIPLSYTLENSSFGYIDDNGQTQSFRVDTLCGVGEQLIRSIYEYEFLLHSEGNSKKGVEKRTTDRDVSDKSVQLSPETPEVDPPEGSEENRKLPSEYIAIGHYSTQNPPAKSLQQVIERIKNNETICNDSGSEDSDSEPEFSRSRIPRIQLRTRHISSHRHAPSPALPRVHQYSNCNPTNSSRTRKVYSEANYPRKSLQKDSGGPDGSSFMTLAPTVRITRRIQDFPSHLYRYLRRKQKTPVFERNSACIRMSRSRGRELEISRVAAPLQLPNSHIENGPFSRYLPKQKNAFACGYSKYRKTERTPVPRKVLR